MIFVDLNVQVEFSELRFKNPEEGAAGGVEYCCYSHKEIDALLEKHKPAANESKE